MKKGFYVYMYGKDCFFETSAKNRTRKLALEFISKVQAHINISRNITDDFLLYIQKGMREATLEVKSCKWGKFIDIKGDGFVAGCDPCENPMEVCVIV